MSPGGKPSFSISGLKVQLSGGQYLLLGIMAVAVGAVLAARLLYLPVLGMIAEQRTTLHELKVKLSDADVLIAERDSYESVRQEVSERHEALREWSRGREAMPRILERLGRLAAEKKLELTTVQPPATDSVDPFSLAPGVVLREVPLHLTLGGKYPHIGEFLAVLAEEPYISIVRSMTIVKSDASGVGLQADVDLGVFWMEGGS